MGRRGGDQVKDGEEGRGPGKGWGGEEGPGKGWGGGEGDQVKDGEEGREPGKGWGGGKGPGKGWGGGYASLKFWTNSTTREQYMT